MSEYTHHNRRRRIMADVAESRRLLRELDDEDGKEGSSST